jgi:transketolase
MNQDDTSATRELRRSILTMAFDSQEGHVPSALSIVEPIYTVFKEWDLGEGGDDTFILSKGHGCLALYSVLKSLDLITSEELKLIGANSGALGGHPDVTKVPSVRASTGSLGHGFPMAVGLAYSKKHFSKGGRVLALLGDGECNEGSVWEAALLASNHGLSNLVAWVDYNHSGDRAVSLEPLVDKWAAFGFQVVEVDGHDLGEISQALRMEREKPTAIISHSVKGKGVSFMENSPQWHHSLIDAGTFESAMKELA